jgi:hypothetical protein
MSKISAALGDRYEAALTQIRTRAFTMGGHEFKVRIPLSAEMDAILERIAMTPDAEVAKRLEKMTSALRDNPPENVVIKEDGDVEVDGRSTREVVNSVLRMENRVVEYVRLLVPVNGNLDDITYAEIESEWPLSVQLALLEAIDEVIQPGYKEARKNS